MMLRAGKRLRKDSGGRGTAVLCALSAMLCGLAVWAVQTARWEARHWDNLKMNEVVVQLATSVEGTGSEIIGEFLTRCVLPGGAVALALLLLVFALRKRQWLRRAALVGAIFGGAVLAGMLVYGWQLLGVGEYLHSERSVSSYIEDHYADPGTVQLRFPEKKRNLIYIWLESVESTFSDTDHGGAFERDVISPLTALAREGECFAGAEGAVNGGRSLAGATWTMGALFAQTSGLPLKIPITDASMDAQEHFFPGVVTLGDILADHGYRQCFLLGSDAAFSGRRLYFTEHGGYEIRDYNYSKECGEIPEDYYVWWGYEDQKLFSHAREWLTAYAASDEPFNLTLLTVDTHFPDGYVCPLCSDEYGEDRYSNVMACSARQVEDFVRWVQAQPFYENTTIVLCGDHVTMNVGYCDDVPEDYPRRVYTNILNPAAENANPGEERDYSTMDLFPTTLAALGVSIEGERLGLGVNLFSGERTLVEQEGAGELDSALKSRSPFLDRLSGIDESVYRLSAALGSLDTELTASFDDEGILFTAHRLTPYEGEFGQLMVFEEIIEENTRITFAQGTAEPDGDGGYRVKIPYTDPPNGAERFTVNLYVTTDGGRIRVDQGYECSVAEQSLSRRTG